MLTMWRRYSLGAVVLLVLTLSLAFKFTGNAYATTGINQEMSFEGKIATNAAGVNIANGTYNMEFNIYTGCTNNTGTGCTSVWTEDWLVHASNGVVFNGGTFQVNLGAVNSLSSIPVADWNTYPLYLSVEVGTTADSGSNSCAGPTNFGTNCGGDGIMSPYILLTSTPYSFDTSELGGIAASGFGQIASTNTWSAQNIFQAPVTAQNSFSLEDAGVSPFSFQVLNNLGLPILTAGSNNLVINSDFESNTTGWATFGTGSSISQNTVQANSYSGNDSLAVAITGSANAGTQITNFNQTLPIGTYVLKFEAKASVGFSTLAASFGSGTCTLNSNSVTTAYSNYFCTVTTTGVTTAISIDSTGTTSLTFYLDAVQVVPATNLLTNPGFENGSTGWATFGTGSSITLNQNTNFAYGGIGSLKIVTGTTGNAGAQVTSFISNMPAGTYTLSFEAGYAGTAFSTLAASFGTGTCTLSPSPATINVPTTGFVNYSCTVTTTGVTTAISIDSTSATSSTFYIDTVQVSGTGGSLPYNIGAIQLRGVINNPVVFQNLSNSTSEFQIANVAGSDLFSVDSFDSVVLIGSSNATNTTQTLLQLNSDNTLVEVATCSTTTNQGALYYNNASNNVRACVNGSWQDLVSTASLATLLFGVVPNSGTNPGDLIGASATATVGDNGGPCKVNYDSTSAVFVNSCLAYSGGREVSVAALAVTVQTGASTYQNICLNSSGVPALEGTSSTTKNSESFNNLTTTNATTDGQPLLCLATVETGTTSGSMNGGHIYDLRTFTTTTKTFATDITIRDAYLGAVMTPSATSGEVVAATSATGLVQGVVVASNGAAGALGAPNIMIAISGPQWIFASTGTVNDNAIPSTVAGVATGATATALANNDNLGLVLNTYATSCATGTVVHTYGASDCNYSDFVYLNIT